MITVTPEEVEEVLEKEKDLQIIDIRQYSSFKKSRITGAISIPRDRIAQFMHKIKKEKPILVYCQYGMKSDEIALFMEKKFNTKAYVIDGGYEAYIEAF